jgi:Na+/H+ antiporter NhaC
LEVDGICASPGAFEMKTFFKIVVWMTALFLGLLVWNGLPDFRPLVSSILAAAFVCYVLSVIVEITVKRVIANEQLELRSRLEVLDRKVTAILRDAVEQRRVR